MIFEKCNPVIPELVNVLMSNFVVQLLARKTSLSMINMPAQIRRGLITLFQERQVFCLQADMEIKRKKNELNEERLV